MSKFDSENIGKVVKKMCGKGPEVLDGSESTFRQSWSRLPFHVVEQIFQHLSYRDLKMVALVCSQWNDVIIGSLKLWSNYNVFMDGDMSCNLSEFRRNIRSMTLSANIDEKVLEELLQDKRISTLFFEDDQKVFCKYPKLLANVVSTMESVSFGVVEICENPDTHLNIFFGELAKGHKLKSLSFNSTDLLDIDPEVLGQVVKSIEKVELNSTPLTDEQVVGIFGGFCETKKIRHLSLYESIIFDVVPERFIDGLKFVTYLCLRMTDLTNIQLNALFCMVQSSTSLSHLSIERIDLQLVDPGLLSRAIIKLKVINLIRVYMDFVTWETLLRAMATEQSCLIEADFSGNDYLLFLDPSTLATAVTNVITMKLEFTDFSSQACSLIFYTISNQQTKIKHLNMSYNDLSGTDASALAKCGYKLVSLNLKRTQLSDDQLKILFQMWSANDITLKEVKMALVNLHRVNADNVAVVINKLEVADLTKTHCTNAQLTALFSKMASVTLLKNLNISGNDLSSVDPEMLAKAVNNIERVNLSNTRLTYEQASAILSQCELRTKLIYLNISGNNLCPIQVNRATKSIVKIVQEKCF